MEKPGWLFDRAVEWSQLEEYTGGAEGTRLAVVYGRRRQGKTALTRAWCEAAGGFHWEAAEVEGAQNLESLGAAWTRWSGSAGEVRFASWSDAVGVLCSVGRTHGKGRTPVVIDEVNRVIGRVPELPSLIQRELGPGGAAHQHGGTRLTLCGSAFGAMRRLLDGPAALRGRAGLELILEPFDFRTAAAYWGLDANPDAAFVLHALIGGTPAYLELAGEDRPSDGNVDAWAVRRLLDPASALHREGRIVVAEDAQLADQQLYWALLAAVADGNHRWGDIERTLGGAGGSLKHILDVTLEAGWLTRREDPLRARRPTYEIAEPMIRFHRLVVEPHAARLATRRQPDLVWNDAKPGVASRIFGPHLETLTYDWVARFADPATVGGVVHRVGPSRLPNRMQVDVVVTERRRDDAGTVTAVGEVKATSEPMGVSELDRLDVAVAAVPDGRAAEVVKRLLVSRSGFTAGLSRAAATRSDVELVDLHRLYHGG